MSVPPSLLLVRSPLLGVDLEAAFLERVAVRVVDPGELSLELLQASRKAGGRALVGVNHSPTLALLCREAGLRYVSWTVDPLPRERWQVVPGADTILFVHRQVLLDPLRAMGHSRVEWMPLAAPARRWEEVPPPPTPLPASFVGSSLQDERGMFHQALARWGVSQAAPALEALFEDLSEVAAVDRGFHGFFRDPSLVPAALVGHLEGRVSREDIAESLDAGLAWVYRRQQVRRWAALGLEVHGDGGWREVVGERWRGPLRNGQEMTQLYRHGRLNVDVPRLHQREIATLRAFDVMASGGLLLVESGTELETLFRAGEEFLAWKEPAQCREILERSLRDPAWAGGIALAGREAARSHRLDLRVAKILEVLE